MVRFNGLCKNKSVLGMIPVFKSILSKCFNLNDTSLNLSQSSSSHSVLMPHVDEHTVRINLHLSTTKLYFLFVNIYVLLTVQLVKIICFKHLSL
jgi:hypothetical protein